MRGTRKIILLSVAAAVGYGIAQDQLRSAFAWNISPFSIRPFLPFNHQPYWPRGGESSRRGGSVSFSDSCWPWLRGLARGSTCPRPNCCGRSSVSRGDGVLREPSRRRGFLRSLLRPHWRTSGLGSFLGPIRLSTLRGRLVRPYCVICYRIPRRARSLRLAV